MKIDFDPKDLKDTVISIGTPMYGGMSSYLYTSSMIDLTAICTIYGIKLNLHITANESLISRARNIIAKEFLESDSEFLMFIDADIAFDPYDVLYMAYLSKNDPTKNIMVGPYPRKKIDFEKIKLALDHNLVKSLSELEEFTSDPVMNVPYTENVNLYEPLPIVDGGTGFMMIKRAVFEDFQTSYPEQQYLQYVTDEKMFAFFDCKIDPDTKYYLSEDYMFCQYATKIGHKVWLLPWMNLHHIGPYIFKGNLKKTSLINRYLQ